MSFSLQHQGKKDEVLKKVVEEAYTPASVKDFIAQAIKVTKSEQVFVKAYGHMHDGEVGNYPDSTCTIEVKPVTV